MDNGNNDRSEDREPDNARNPELNQIENESCVIHNTTNAPYKILGATACLAHLIKKICAIASNDQLLSAVA
jgi:hypothetical protein